MSKQNSRVAKDLGDPIQLWSQGMKTSNITTQDLRASVFAVLPLGRNRDLSVNEEDNRKLIRHVEEGGVSSLMYGGNANFYHIPVSEYEDTLAFIAEAAGADTWVIPSLGPDYGRLIDQAAVLARTEYPTAMALPQVYPITAEGIVCGLTEASQRFGKPVILYIKQDRYLPAATVGKLFDEGTICAVKYAVVREDPSQDPYLRELIDVIGAAPLISGIGERPVIKHFRDFGLGAFTSGSVCVAPATSMAILAALQAGDFDSAARLRARMMPLEDQRDAISAIRVLHDAVTLAGIADMGRILPLLDNLSEQECAQVRGPAKELLAAELELRAA